MVSLCMAEETSNRNRIVKSYHSKFSGGLGVTIFVIENQERILNLGRMVEILSKVHHKNVMSLVGYCSVKQKVSLIYESMGQLNSLSYMFWTDAVCDLDLKTRINIGLQVATGLEYLHTGCSPSLIHGCVNSDNICINSKNEAKLFGFDLEQLISGVCLHRDEPDDLDPLDPEYRFTEKLSTKSDVYSFGVLLKRLLLYNGYGSDNGDLVLDLPQYLEKISKMDLINVDAFWKSLEVALCCVELLSKERPSMSEVVVGLRYALELEEYPSMRDPLVRNKVMEHGDEQIGFSRILVNDLETEISLFFGPPVSFHESFLEGTN